MNLKDKVGFITGGVSGIGYATAELLLQHGAKVAVIDVNSEAGRTAVSNLAVKYGEANVIFVKCDVTEDGDIEEAFKQTIAKYGRLDVIMNNAGILNESNYKLMISVNLTAAITGTMLGMKYLRKDQGGNGGVILNMSSISGLKPSLCLPAYAATKHGIVGYTRSMANSMAADINVHGVRFNCVCPEFTDTPMVRSLESVDSLNRRGIHHAQALSNYVSENVDGMIKVSYIADNIIKLLADETKNGAAMLITSKGVAFIDPPEHPYFSDRANLKR
ncbi:15-hydroxyprostaglandin dehydrogenase [NAD(+)] [Lingula anatina]|uniref:15-hydroxyprostaglandin dehydrogenase [NAD(+)] n=1 Tax=Lingula anatina TaxID=7574 RepID=A0A1S3IUI5_LINAN|nr:15-hydroxyprostaglandin dehydrogenase [NAD(+)] [Lingula anatina]|eukprot:XP_013401738.1 15-hydroxyprostaglandin dehydrogenase [NAD(+)] [Lingula anatina]